VAAFAAPFTPERCDATGRFGFGDSGSRGALAGGRTGHLLASAALVQRFRLRRRGSRGFYGRHTEGMSRHQTESLGQRQRPSQETVGLRPLGCDGQHNSAA